ncbi:hypothetical protein Tco_0419411 [Tanacetum coccineum]
MHKEAQQAADDPTSLGATSEEGAHPQLSSGHEASADSTTEVNPGLSAPNDFKDELEQQNTKAEAKIAALKARPYYPDINQLIDILVTSLKPELSKLLDSHKFASCLPTDLKNLPSKFTELSREIKELKQHVKDMEIELPRDLKEIPTKLETFTFTISSFTSQVVELKNIQWELPAEFTTVMENASNKTKDVPSVGQATASPAKGEKNTKDVDTNLKDELVDLLGKNIVTQHYTKKLLFDKYCDKMLKERKALRSQTVKLLQRKALGRLLASSASALQVLRRLGSIFTLVYAAVHKLKNDSWKELQFSLVNNSKSLSSKEITPQMSVNYLAILQARLQAEGSDVDMTKHGEGFENRVRAEALTGGQGLPPCWAETSGGWARPIFSLPRLYDAI